MLFFSRNIFQYNVFLHKNSFYSIIFFTNNTKEILVKSMKIVGIIAEYNPFHNGHQYHIDQALLKNGDEMRQLSL